MLAELPRMSPSEIRQNPQRHAQLFKARREHLEALLWVEPTQAVLEKIIDIVDVILAERVWIPGAADFGPCGGYGPFRPPICIESTQTGVLLAWLVRKHGMALRKADPMVNSYILHAVRQRLFTPVLAHDSYPFMNGECNPNASIVCDLIFACLMLEDSPSRRQPLLKKLLRCMDEVSIDAARTKHDLEDRLMGACAVADLARLIKRLTRGEMDLTRSVPNNDWLDSILIPWISDQYFLGNSLTPEVSGADIFRLGYLTRDKNLCAIGAQLHRRHERPAASVTGRILSVEYAHALQEECAAPPMLRRAVSPDGCIMLSRAGGLFAGMCVNGLSNPGDITIFADGTPVVVNLGGRPRCSDMPGAEYPHSFPVINGVEHWDHFHEDLPGEYDFADDRDLMSADLTGIFDPRTTCLSAYQRTLMLDRDEGLIRLIEAFEFAQAPREIEFRFVTALRPLVLFGCVRLGPLTLTWDGEMRAAYEEIDCDGPFAGKAYLLRIHLRETATRMICGFRFERNGS